MDKEKRTRLLEIKRSVCEEFDVRSDEFPTKSPSATSARYAFTLLARADGFDNPHIATFLKSTPKSVSNVFAKASQRDNNDREYWGRLESAATALTIDLSKS